MKRAGCLAVGSCIAYLATCTWGCDAPDADGDGDLDADVDTDGDGDVDGDADADGDADDDADTTAPDAGCLGLVHEGDYQIRTEGTSRALAGYSTITGSLAIVNYPRTQLFELECLTTIGGSLTIDNALRLRNVDVLASLTSIGGGLEISVAPELRSLEGLAGVTELTGGLRISATPLPSLTGLEGLTLVDDGVSIVDNDSLTELRGLCHVAAVARGGLEVRGNAALERLCLDDLDALEGDLAIVDNAALPACDAEALVERLRTSGWTGPATLSDNTGSGSCE